MPGTRRWSRSHVTNGRPTNQLLVKTKHCRAHRGEAPFSRPLWPTLDRVRVAEEFLFVPEGSGEPLSGSLRVQESDVPDHNKQCCAARTESYAQRAPTNKETPLSPWIFALFEPPSDYPPPASRSRRILVSTRVSGLS
ncbi:hypothetical protein KM043_009166 [Ampulex compressa]|nr:hypothetical protein KM043_009166 [Ampulex compressa]